MSAHARYRSWVVMLPLVGAVIVYAALFLLPNRRAIANLHNEITEKRDHITSRASAIHRLLSARQELSDARSFIDAWTRQAPSQEALPGLYGKLNALAQTAGMTTTRLDPDPAQSLARIRRIPITMVCRGTFPRAYELIRGLESMPLSLWIESVKIKKTGENGETVECELKLAVFADNQDNSVYVDHSDNPI